MIEVNCQENRSADMDQTILSCTAVDIDSVTASIEVYEEHTIVCEGHWFSLAIAHGLDRIPLCPVLTSYDGFVY